MTAPLAAAPLAGWWVQEAPAAAPVLQPAALTGGEAVWLLRLGVSAAPAATPAPAPLGCLAAAPLAAADRPGDPAVPGPELRLSDRGWTGEPGDPAAPNESYPARLLEPPALELALSVLAETPRRATAAGEIRLANGDGALDSLAGNWSVGGRPVELLRGPHRRPFHAPLSSFTVVARLRAAGAASGTSRLTLALRDATADLAVPVAPLYPGTGGIEGPPSLAGTSKPALYGIKRFVEPVLLDPARFIYAIHADAILAVLAVRDRGMPFVSGGPDIATYAGLEATIPAPGTYRTCLAAGCIRVEPAGPAPSLLTVDARGDAGGVGYSGGTPASIARKLLTGPGGLGTDAIAADAFAAWPVGEAGLWRRGGTVAEALDALCAGLAAWWGTDRLGRVTGGEIAAPEGLAPLWDVLPSMLRAPPEEIPGTALPPRWRHTVGWAAPGRVMASADLADGVGAADRAAWGLPYRAAIGADLAVLAAYPLAADAPPVVSVFDGEGDASALAQRLAAKHGTPRRAWRAALNRAGLAVMPGDPLRLAWPRHGLAAGRVLVVTAVSVRGDRTELTLWG